MDMGAVEASLAEAHHVLLRQDHVVEELDSQQFTDLSDFDRSRIAALLSSRGSLR